MSLYLVDLDMLICLIQGQTINPSSTALSTLTGSCSPRSHTLKGLPKHLLSKVLLLELSESRIHDLLHTKKVLYTTEEQSLFYSLKELSTGPTSYAANPVLKREHL